MRHQIWRMHRQVFATVGGTKPRQPELLSAVIAAIHHGEDFHDFSVTAPTLANVIPGITTIKLPKRIRD